MARPCCAALFADLATITPYFAISTGPCDDSWRPVERLYADTALLDGIIGRVQDRIEAAEQRVAASTFFLGFAARLWSIGVGAVAGHRLLPDLTPEQLLFRESGGQIRLHIRHPVCWRGGDLGPPLADMVLERHLEPLTVALHRLAPISSKLLRGNAASALLCAAQIFDRGAAKGAALQLARRLCSDTRLSDAVVFDGESHRRTSCCIYYRTPGGGLCGDCVLTHVPKKVMA
jgi:iron complex transport system ATP-binding protein